MSISETVSFDKTGRIERFPLFRKLFLSITIVLVAILSFGIGRLSVVGNREPIKVEYDSEIFNSQSVTANQATAVSAVKNIENTGAQTENSTSVVTSKNGRKYHFLYCPGAKQIKEENKIIFSSPVDAEAAGYTLAANCKPR